MWRCVKLSAMFDQRRNQFWNMAVVSCFCFAIQDGTLAEAKVVRALASPGDFGTIPELNFHQTRADHPSLLYRIAETTPEAPNTSSPSLITSPVASAGSPPSDKPNPPSVRSTITAEQAPVESSKAEEARSQSILQMLEGHEIEFKIGLIVAAIAFALGWLCGGSYYARRERKSRHRLRF